MANQIKVKIGDYVRTTEAIYEVTGLRERTGEPTVIVCGTKLLKSEDILKVYYRMPDWYGMGQLQLLPREPTILKVGDYIKVEDVCRGKIFVIGPLEDRGVNRDRLALGITIERNEYYRYDSPTDVLFSHCGVCLSNSCYKLIGKVTVNDI